MIRTLVLAATLSAIGFHGPVQAQTRFVVAGEGNEARYRVREQLAGIDFPSDAVGVTSGITGGITFDQHGQPVRAESKVTIDLTSLKSDRDRRDNFLRRRTLETEQFPNAELVPTAVKGLAWPLPTSGTVTFEMTADFTVHGVTKPTTWQVTATISGGSVTGTAKTQFTFEHAGLTKPRVASVLSVDDDIKLEYDFRLVKP